MSLTIFTIGYEQARVDDVVGALKAAGVTRLLDVRAIAASRRPGFSKTALAGALRENGIAYEHLRALGTPKEGREAARRGDMAALERIYAVQLELPEAQAQTAMMLDRAAAEPTALLCYERDPATCHRSLLIDAVARHAKVVDLFA
jgi:uncharacterized protein (DUF488 family)